MVRGSKFVSQGVQIFFLILYINFRSGGSFEPPDYNVPPPLLLVWNCCRLRNLRTKISLARQCGQKIHLSSFWPRHGQIKQGQNGYNKEFSSKIYLKLLEEIRQEVWPFFGRKILTWTLKLSLITILTPPSIKIRTTNGGSRASMVNPIHKNSMKLGLNLEVLTF